MHHKKVWAVGGRYHFQFPYAAAVVEELKRRIPAHARSWHKSTKVWAVDGPYRHTMRDLLVNHFGYFPDLPDEAPDNAEVERLRREVAALREQLRQAAHIPEPYRALYVLPDAPPEVVRAVHRTLVKLHHPDVGGDLITMQRINDAADQLQRKEAC